MKTIKSLILGLFLNLGFALLRYKYLQDLEALAKSGKLFRFLSESDQTSGLSIGVASDIVKNSRAQLGQDVLALSIVGTARPGFFVEFGATDGIDMSNTYMLEKNHGWKGVLCEPARSWHPVLKATRTSSIETKVVYSSSGKSLSFSETTAGSLSTLTAYVDSDLHKKSRKTSATYQVESISLLDLLDTYEAPHHIDFLSIDTEGSELEILSAFDFSKYSFGLICVEHNYTENRSKISALLTENGYKQIYEEESLFDDWYVGPARTH